VSQSELDEAMVTHKTFPPKENISNGLFRNNLTAYMNTRRPVLRSKYNKLSAKQITNICIEEFRYMSDEDKRSYNDSASSVCMIPTNVEVVVQDAPLQINSSSNEQQPDNVMVVEDDVPHNYVSEPPINDNENVNANNFISPLSAGGEKMSEDVDYLSVKEVLKDTTTTAGPGSCFYSAGDIIEVLTGKHKGLYSRVDSIRKDESLVVTVIADDPRKGQTLHSATLKFHQVRKADNERAKETRKTIGK
jgi:hypothetical protein